MCYNTSQLDFLTQDLTKPISSTAQDHQTLFSSSCPLFMFDTTAIEGAADSTTTTTTATTTSNTLRGEFFQDILTMGHLNSDTTTTTSSSSWNLNQHQVQALPPSLVLPSFSSATMNISYLPPLIENMDNMVHVEEGDDQIALDCLQRQELMNCEWVESQQVNCSNNFLFWENVVVESAAALGAGESNMLSVAPTSNSSNLGMSSFPSSL